MPWRDQARDVVRGLNVLEMTVVNITTVGFLQHGRYIDRPTYADTIFPTFALLAGMSRSSSSRRTVAMVGLGLALNAVQAVVKGVPTRIPGVLQRLALSGAILDFVPVIRNNLASSPLAVAAGLIALWYGISIAGTTDAPNPFANPGVEYCNPSTTAASRIDVASFGERIYTAAYDPEGLLGCLTTAVTMLIGRWLGTGGRDPLSRSTLTVASTLVASGYALDYLSPAYAPFSKALWTPSFAATTAGFGILKYAAVALLHRSDLIPAAVGSVLTAVGQRSLEIYILSTLANLSLQYDARQRDVPGKRRYSTHFARDDSIWAQAIAALTQLYATVLETVAPEAVQQRARGLADLTLSLSLAGAMAAAAVFMVKYDIKLRL